jgi:bacillithiol biosynthesis deacetylase BshB1
MDDPLDVLAVMAHPDDAELLCGGALIRATDAGRRVGVVDLTRGESGTHGSASLRAEEADRAAEIMGLAVRRNAELPDAALFNSPEARQVVSDLVRELRPRVVVTHWIEGRHPDHRVAAELVYDACYLAGLASVGVGAPHRPFKVVHATAYREDADPPSFVVDVTEQMERKLEAMAAYGSQFVGKTAMGEVFPGGNRSLFDQVRAHCARYGSLIRTLYGEPFRCRETFAIDDLAQLEVSTF